MSPIFNIGSNAVLMFNNKSLYVYLIYVNNKNRHQ